MLAHNTINYMRIVAADLLGYEPDGETLTPDGATYPTEWLMNAGPDADLLARHMRDFGYTVTSHGGGTIGVSGTPTNVERIRDLEVRIAREHVAHLETAEDDIILQRAARL